MNLTTPRIPRRPYVALLLLAALVAGCATGPKMQRLRPEMTESEVVGIMGQPDGRIRDGIYQALRWANRLMSGWSWDRADYWVLLKDGVVDSYGPGEIRRSAPGVLVLVLLRP